MNEHDPLDEPVGAGPLPDPDGSDDLSPTARSLRDALAARAAAVEPADHLEEIRMSTRTRRRSTRAWQAVAVAAAVVVVGGGTAAALRGGGDGTVTTVAASSSSTAPTPAAASPAPPSPSPTTPAATPSSTGSATSTPSATTTATSTASAVRTASADPLPSGAASVPVYWLGGQPPKLFREYVAVSGGADDPTNALRAMLAGKAGDPDYTSPWSPDPSATVTAQGGRLVVDLAASAAAGDLDVGAVTAAVQQLVHTVTAAAGDDAPVEVRVDGKSEPLLFGYAVARTVSRAPQADVQAPAWITSLSPAPGSVTVEGVGTAFEGTLLYTVTDAAGAEVARDSVQAGANGTYAEFSFTVALPAGSYTVSVLAPDESGGEGAAPLADTKQVTVS